MEMSKLVDFQCDGFRLQRASGYQTEWSRYAASRQTCGIAKEAIPIGKKLKLERCMKESADM